MGHLRSVCWSKQRRVEKQQHVHNVHVAQVEEDDMGPLYVLQARNRVSPLKVTVELDSHPLSMEVDTGAAYSLVSKATYRVMWPDKQPVSVM